MKLKERGRFVEYNSLERNEEVHNIFVRTVIQFGRFELLFGLVGNRMEGRMKTTQ